MLRQDSEVGLLTPAESNNVIFAQTQWPTFSGVRSSSDMGLQVPVTERYLKPESSRVGATPLPVSLLCGLFMYSTSIL